MFWRPMILLLITILGASLLGTNPSARAATANDAFDAVWATTDQAVANGTATYSWFWGPEPRAQRFEPYTESPGGQREVRYYDKSRMEINTPGNDYVTNGLLTVELVTGRLQRGDNDFEQRAPAPQPVAGDLANNPGTPSYAAFKDYVTHDGMTNRSPDQTSQAVTAYMSGAGQVSMSDDTRGVTLTSYADVTGHNIASVFWDWFNSPTSGFRPEVGVNWIYAAGFPISEPYWIDATVGGSVKRVLVQLFERRVMTYTDSNQDPYRIEWGNIGLHYLAWRDAGAPVDAPPVFTSVPSDINILKDQAATSVLVDWLSPVAVDVSDGPVPVTCTPPARSNFPLGTTQVTCVATDTAGNAASVTFSVTVSNQYTLQTDGDVSPNDVSLIQRGIALGTSFVAERLNVTQRSSLIVTISTRDICGSTASYGNDRLCFYVAHPVWTSATPQQKVKIAAHEYFHAIQDELGCLSSTGPSFPVWLIEGAAEFIGYEVVVANGLLDEDAVTAFHVNQLHSPDLALLEDYEASYGPGPIYSLWYLAARELSDQSGETALASYCQAVGTGTTWQDAFSEAFGQSVDTFYVVFEAARQDLLESGP